MKREGEEESVRYDTKETEERRKADENAETGREEGAQLKGR